MLAIVTRKSIRQVAHLFMGLFFGFASIAD